MRDTGIGIAEDERERIFEAFQRGDRRRADDRRGHRARPHAVARIVELHGGRLWMDERARRGQHVRLRPARCAAAPRPTATAPAGSRATRAAADVVLVIEDDPRSADLLGVYLDDAGYETRFVHDGRRGWSWRARSAPARSCWTSCCRASTAGTCSRGSRPTRRPRSCPVVIVSILDERAKGLSLGASEYLVKPVGREQLLAALEVA